MNNNGNGSLKWECDYNSADSHMGAKVATVKPEECKLYVAGIKKSVGNVPMCQVFRKFGVVKEAFNTRQGFGFVTFSNSDEAQNCMKTFNGSEALGQEIYIAPAKEKRNVDKVTGDKNGMRQGKDLCGENFEWIHSGSGIGRKLMEKAGWRNGESLGIKGDGLKRALDGRDFGQSSRYGLGFGNYLLVNNNLKKKMWEKPNQSVLANKINKEYTPGKFKDKKEFTLKEKAKKEEYNIKKENAKKEFKIRKENLKKEKWKIKKERVMKEAKIKTHLQAGKFNDAYQTALSARYSSLVMYTCEMLDPVQLFDHEKCPLTQPVLLSLIQQLGVDFQDKTELKLRYLFEAVVNLDVTNPTTRKQIVGTMAGLRTALLNYIQINPSSKMTANMRMLQMAIHFKTDVVRVVKTDF